MKTRTLFFGRALARLSAVLATIVSTRAEFTLELIPGAPGSAALVFTREAGYYYNLEAAKNLTDQFSPVSGWMLGDGLPVVWPLSYPTNPSSSSGSPTSSPSNNFAIYPFANGKTLITWTDGATSPVSVLVVQDYFGLPPIVAVPASGSLPSALLLVGSLAWNPAYESLTAGLLPPAQQAILGQLPSPAAATLAANAAGTSGGGVAVDAARQFFRLRRVPVDADGDGISWVDEVFRFGTNPEEAEEGVLTREDLLMGVGMLGVDAALFGSSGDADIFANDGSEASSAALLALREAATYRVQDYGVASAPPPAPPPPPALSPSQVSGLRLYSRYEYLVGTGGVAVLSWDGNIAGRSTFNLERENPGDHTWQVIASFPAEPREFTVLPSLAGYDNNFRLGPAPYSNETETKIQAHTDWVTLSRRKPGFLDFRTRAGLSDLPPRVFRMWSEVTTDDLGNRSQHVLALDPLHRSSQWLLRGRYAAAIEGGGQATHAGLAAGLTKWGRWADPTTERRDDERLRLLETRTSPAGRSIGNAKERWGSVVQQPPNQAPERVWNQFRRWDARETGSSPAQYYWQRQESSDGPPVESSGGGSVTFSLGSYPRPNSWPGSYWDRVAFQSALNSNSHATVLEYELVGGPHSTITLSGAYTTAKLLEDSAKLMPAFAAADKRFQTPPDERLVWGLDDGLILETRHDELYNSSAYSLIGDGTAHAAKRTRSWFTSNDCLPVTVLVKQTFQPEDWTAEPEVVLTAVDLGQGRSTTPKTLDPLKEKKLGSYDVETLMVDIVPDFNRDGKIDGSDRGHVTDSDPWRFWVNDDDDDGDSGSTSMDDISQTPAADGGDSRVDGLRDLVDWFPLWLDLKQALTALPAAQYDYILESETPALHYIETKLSRSESSKYLVGALGSPSIRDNPNGIAAAALVKPILYQQAKLSADFLAGILNDTGGIVLIEAARVTDKPLKVVIRKKGTAEKLAEVPLPLKIDRVDKMYRHLNLLAACGQSGGHATSLGEPPNYPDTLCNQKYFVFLHGYNVNAEQARGWNNETFKRMWWSRSRAKFVGVTWYGSETQIPPPFGITVNYHRNVINAIASAQMFTSEISTLSGEITVGAHSLGNMVVASAIYDWSAPVTRYYLVDAALSMEALDGSEQFDENMTHPNWIPHTERLWASEWHSLFGGNDARSTLTWRDRFPSVSGIAFNFYSSTEDILETHPAGNDPGVLDLVNTLQVGRYSWALQEKLKGRITPPDQWNALINQAAGTNYLGPILGSSYGGWGFNLNSPNFTVEENGTRRPMTPAEAAAVPDGILRSDSFFLRCPNNLYGANGSQYAAANRSTLLAEAFPARTSAVGSHPVPKLTLDATEERNFDMSMLYRSGWPASRAGNPIWKHSDMSDVAYLFIHLLFENFVTKGQLDE